MKKRLSFFTFGLFSFFLVAPASALEFDRPYGLIGTDLGYQRKALPEGMTDAFRTSLMAGFGEDVYLSDYLVFSFFGRLKSYLPTAYWGSGGLELACYDALLGFNLFLDGAIDGTTLSSPTSSLWLSAERALPFAFVGSAEVGGFRTTDSLGCWSKGGINRKFGALRLFLDGRGELARYNDGYLFPSSSVSLGGQHPFLFGSSLWALGEYLVSDQIPSRLLLCGTSWIF